MEVRWEEPTRFDALGRNGYIRSCGLSVLMIGNELFLEPLTSRGEIGRARIVVPIKAAPKILDAIVQECRLMLQREGLYPRTTKPFQGSPECLNSRLSHVPTEDEIAAMEHGTLLDWDTPGANPSFWRRRRELNSPQT